MPAPWWVKVACPKPALPPRQTAGRSWVASQSRTMAACPPALPPLLPRPHPAGSCCAAALRRRPPPACRPGRRLLPAPAPAAAPAAGWRGQQCPHSRALPCSCPPAPTHQGCAAVEAGVGRCQLYQREAWFHVPRVPPNSSGSAAIAEATARFRRHACSCYVLATQQTALQLPMASTSATAQRCTPGLRADHPQSSPPGQQPGCWATRAPAVRPSRSGSVRARRGRCQAVAGLRSRQQEQHG